jgi:4-amino-4-deoxy-L-arabinose transferase-like glycosyltransferase
MLRNYFISLEKETIVQYLLAALCIIVYAGTFFFPLMDKDAARHANVALHMYQTGDYFSLVDRNINYLDKPHFLFWSSLLSFKIFGVNTFAHRLPHFLFALIAIYSTYKLTLHLSDKTTAKLAALMLATAQTFVLAIMDARMETPLTAGIIFGLWQLIVYVDKQKFMHLLLAALGAAIAFSTKGWVGPVIIFIAAFFYIFLSKKWIILAKPKTWLFIPLFFLFISPVLYAYYVQFDLHPAIMVRGRNHISGVKFILWQQNFERFEGDGFAKGGRNSGYFFLYHTFLWAFFPWSIIAYAGLAFWLKRMFYNRKWRYSLNFTALSFAVILFLISFSKFKMPHYIIMLFPLAAIFTASYLRLTLSYKKGLRFYLPFQLTIACLVIPVILILNYYFFKPANPFVQITGPVLLIILLLLIIKHWESKALKVIFVSALLSLVLNFFLNYSFFPNLMKYQGGNELAKTLKEKNILIPDKDIMLMESSAHTFDFYRAYNHPLASLDSFSQMYPSIKDKYFIVNGKIGRQLEAEGFTIQPVVQNVDYNVSTITFKFLNSKSRASKLDTLMLAKVIKR